MRAVVFVFLLWGAEFRRRFEPNYGVAARDGQLDSVTQDLCVQPHGRQDKILVITPTGQLLADNQKKGIGQTPYPLSQIQHGSMVCITNGDR